ncbi:proline-rich protein HaeIII subfamily 1-like [Aphelocoma coerulescens]|uniref:proline-rich protein HaeIII subfamily 1-like n=1 Tax=Aphelocoma coerulescens TaxID=39617 RepID=UPI00360448DF
MQRADSSTQGPPHQLGGDDRLSPPAPQTPYGSVRERRHPAGPRSPPGPSPPPPVSAPAPSPAGARRGEGAALPACVPARLRRSADPRGPAQAGAALPPPRRGRARCRCPLPPGSSCGTRAVIPRAAARGRGGAGAPAGIGSPEVRPPPRPAAPPARRPRRASAALGGGPRTRSSPRQCESVTPLLRIGF